MSDRPRILAFAGSTRQDSYNKRLVELAARAAGEAGAEVTRIDLRDFPMPLFDEDLERDSGPPEHAARLKALMKRQDGFLIASPEYNSSVTAVLKNAIDWTSRPGPDEPPLAAFQGKAAVLLSASPGALGGLRGLVHLRAILGNIGVLVMPDQITLPRAFEVFNEDGSLRNAAHQASVEALGRSLAGLLAKIKA